MPVSKVYVIRLDEGQYDTMIEALSEYLKVYDDDTTALDLYDKMVMAQTTGETRQ